MDIIKYYLQKLRLTGPSVRSMRARVDNLLQFPDDIVNCSDVTGLGYFIGSVRLHQNSKLNRLDDFIGFIWIGSEALAITR